MENTTINITEELTKRLKSIGYKCEISPLIKYHIGENVKHLFGNEEVPKNDVDIFTSADRIEIKSIYNNYTYFIFAGHDEENKTDFIRCERKICGNEEACVEFTITDSELDCTNNSLLNANEIYKVKSLDYNKTENRFTLTYTTIEPHGDKGNIQTCYQASLVPLYARSKNKDWFCYERYVPPVEKEVSFLKKIHDELSGLGQSRTVITANNVHDIVDFAPEIYKSLQEDAIRVLKTSFEEDEPNPGEQKREFIVKINSLF